MGVYTGDRLNQISFPLGGIGTGCIGLAGSGRLIDWEIFNRPNKGSINGYSHFAVKAERDGQVLDARVLNGDLTTDHSGELRGGAHSADQFGFGPSRGHMAGAPHMDDVVFTGEFPIAHLAFASGSFPGAVEMAAFNPFIPLNEDDSSIPAALFEIRVRNTGPTAIRYTVAMSLSNPAGLAENVLSRDEGAGISALKLRPPAELAADDPAYGDLCVATGGAVVEGARDAGGTGAGPAAAGEVWGQEYWFRGAWFDGLEVFWREFAAPGPMPQRSYTAGYRGRAPVSGAIDTGTLAAAADVPPGTTCTVRFVVSWSYPNFARFWQSRTESEPPARPPTWRNHYATQFADSVASARYTLQHWLRLHAETARFKEALYGSTLPPAALEAAAANLAVLKTPTCLRLTDGSFYGFEGLRPTEGCCEGSCTHVWNYAYALPFLFPRLERSMRDLDFTHNQRPDGGMTFRLRLPLGEERSPFRPCADGQFGGVIKTYRDWKICGDSDWLRRHWPAVKKSIEFAWAESNEDQWDADRDGVLEGRQHHTLDMELFGPNSWLTGFYLGALKAGAEMAQHLGEVETAGEYRRLFQRGRRWVDDHLFNGSWYHQQIDVRDRSILERFLPADPDIIDTYWNDEAGEIKYQIAEGSEIDQLNAQWHANLCGLGDLFDPAQRRTALRSLYRNNFKSSMRDFFNACRIYCMNEEGGLVISDWPEGTYRPVVPLPYAGETQNGYEYQAAILMIQEGLVEEGLTAVAAIRDRYDGARRNPWNEFECGSNYARSMAAWSLILAFSGFEYDMVHGMVGFDPLQAPEEGYRTVWSLDSGWGTFAMAPGRLTLAVLAGELTLSMLRIPSSRADRVTGATLRSGAPDAPAAPVRVQHAAARSVVFPDRVTLAAGQELVVECAT